MLIGACVGFIVFTVPAFMLLGTMNFWVILLVGLLMCLLLTISDGTLASYLTETFPDRCALLRLRPLVQSGEHHLRQLGLVHLVLVDRPHGQRHRAGLVHGGHRSCRVHRRMHDPRPFRQKLDDVKSKLVPCAATNEEPLAGGPSFVTVPCGCAAVPLCR